MDEGTILMACYVDDVQHAFGNMKMCHLWSDTEAELLEMVDKIGVQRKWIQGHPDSMGLGRKASWVHFDIAMSKKKLAIQAGAILTDRYGPVMHTARLNGDTDRISTIRALRAREGKDLDTGRRK